MIRLARNVFSTVNLLCLSTIVHAQSYAGPDPARLEAQLKGVKAMVARWELLGTWQLGLAIAVGVLGALVAGLQKFDGKKWCSVSVVAAGVLISLMTVVAKEAFDSDHRGYRKLANVAREEIFQAEINLDIIKSAGTTVEDKHDAANEVVTRISRIGRSGGAIGDSAHASSLADLGIIATAHAQTKVAWISQPRTETSTAIRFVGVGRATSLSEAQTQSLQNAQRTAATDLRIPLDAVSRYGRPINTFTEFDAARRTYSYYTLLEVNRALAPR